MSQISGRESFEDTLHYLYNKLPQYQRQGTRALRKGLRNIHALSAAHGHPERCYPTLHIAGTNGKGTTAHTLAALLSKAGYRTGLYTSPHLRHFCERIQINGQTVSEAKITDYVREYRPLIEQLSPSFFEISFAMALRHFALEKVDIAVVEVGLGGRWDSTNILQPILSLITNISYDHCEILGKTLSEIAYEKAGIAKRGTPLLLGDVDEEAMPVLSREAKKRGATLLRSNNYQVVTRHDTLERRIVDIYHEHQLRYKDLQLGITADYYVDNLSLILFAADKLQSLGFSWKELHLRQVLARCSLKGRFQLLSRMPYIICDMAHNAAALQALFKQLYRLHSGGWHVVFGLSKEKDRSKLLPLLPKEATYYVTQAQLPRACNAEVLAAELRAEGLRAKAYPALRAAYSAARSASRSKELVLLCGSSYLVGEIDT